MLNEHWELKLIDFGLAASTQGEDGSGYLDQVVGTLGYMPPEMHLRRRYKGE